MTINKMFFFLFFPSLIFAQQNSEQLVSKNFKKYSTEKGRITYQVSGNAEGEEVLLFDRNGWRSLKKQTIIFEHQGVKTLQTVHEITDGNHVYRLNGGDSTYTSRTDFRWTQLAATNTPGDTSNEILFMLGGDYVADSTLLDRPCQVWTFSRKSLQELWIWNQLVLKRKIKLGNNIIVTTAQEIDLDTTIDSKLFELPSYFTPKE